MNVSWIKVKAGLRYVVTKIVKEGKKRMRYFASLFHSQFDESHRVLNHDIHLI